MNRLLIGWNPKVSLVPGSILCLSGHGVEAMPPCIRTRVAGLYLIGNRRVTFIHRTGDSVLS
jgi:hypothetical protein